MQHWEQRWDFAQQCQQNVFPQLLLRNQGSQHELLYIEGTDKKRQRVNEDHWEKIIPENCATTSRSRLEEMVMLFAWSLSSLRPTTPPIHQKLTLSQVPGIYPCNTE